MIYEIKGLLRETRAIPQGTIAFHKAISEILLATKGILKEIYEIL